MQYLRMSCSILGCHGGGGLIVGGLRYNDRIFDKKTYLFFMAKYITTVLILTSILDKLSYDLTRSSCNSIYVCRRFAK